MVGVFKFSPADVLTKKYHTNLLDESVSRHLLSTDCLNAKWKLAGGAIRTLYRSNGSKLLAHFSRAGAREKRGLSPLRMSGRPCWS